MGSARLLTGGAACEERTAYEEKGRTAHGGENGPQREDGYKEERFPKKERPLTKERQLLTKIKANEKCEKEVDNPKNQAPQKDQSDSHAYT